MQIAGQANRSGKPRFNEDVDEETKSIRNMDTTSQKLKQSLLNSRANAAAARDGASHISGQQSLRSSIIRRSVHGSQTAMQQNGVTAAKLLEKLSQHSKTSSRFAELQNRLAQGSKAREEAKANAAPKTTQ